ncbi:MAG: hypothetical protein ACI4MT_02770, partial [Christensenellales bacterium]
SDKLTFPELVEIIRIYLVNNSKLDFSAFASNDLKFINMSFNPIIKYMPLTFVNAVSNVIADVIMSIDEPNSAIELLRNMIDDNIRRDGDKIYFGNMSMEKLSKIKSVKTLAGVLVFATGAFGKAEDIIGRYSLNKTTFIKYLKAIFGQEK